MNKEFNHCSSTAENQYIVSNWTSSMLAYWVKTFQLKVCKIFPNPVRDVFSEQQVTAGSGLCGTVSLTAWGTREQEGRCLYLVQEHTQHDTYIPMVGRVLLFFM